MIPLTLDADHHGFVFSYGFCIGNHDRSAITVGTHNDIFSVDFHLGIDGIDNQDAFAGAITAWPKHDGGNRQRHKTSTKNRVGQQRSLTG